MNKIAIALVVGFLASAAHAADINAQKNAAVPGSTATQDAKAAGSNTAAQPSAAQNRY